MGEENQRITKISVQREDGSVEEYQHGFAVVCIPEEDSELMKLELRLAGMEEFDSIKIMDAFLQEYESRDDEESETEETL